ncbi:MAG TPA: fumarylacetoacetate hydrolase family protein [Acidimicrobiales bacterium]|nr:fumarylacetoacetate hydrolase family protein [Acidimicrobiales bacterium]
MRLASFAGGFGEVVGDHVVPFGEDLVAYLEGAPATRGEPVALSSVELLAPVPRPGKVIGIGLNYRAHAAESSSAIPERPIVFAKWASAVSAPGAAVRIPRAATQVDYEAELGVVIGSHARAVGVDEALRHVAGYTVVNDLSARDWQFASGQWTLGKAIDGFLPMGPWLVTTDEITDPQSLRLGCYVNGEVRQDASTSDMIFSVAQIVSYVSTVVDLAPGDVIATGTPSGVAMGMAEPRWLAPGDEVVAFVEGIGELATRLVAG